MMAADNVQFHGAYLVVKSISKVNSLVKRRAASSSGGDPRGSRMKMGGALPYSLALLLCMAISSCLMSSGESFGRLTVRVSLSSLPVNLNGT